MVFMVVISGAAVVFVVVIVRNTSLLIWQKPSEIRTRKRQILLVLQNTSKFCVDARLAL
jgi:hypothetical protein